MNIFKTLTATLLLFLISATLIYSCKKKTTEPATNNTSAGTPTTDYLKIGNLNYPNLKGFKVSAGFVGTSRTTELRIVGAKDTFFTVSHDTILINFPCKSGPGMVVHDSTVFFNCRLGSVAGEPNMATELTAKKYGSYIIKMENGKRVSYFKGIDLLDDQYNKRYVCEGRITWP